MKYRNKETKRHRKPGTETEAGTAAPGWDGQAPERWEMAVQNRSFFPDRVQFSHLFPGFPGISHLFPHRFFLRDEYEDKAHPPAPSHFRGRGDVCWTALPRASLADSLCPGLHIGRPYGAAMCRAAHGRSDLCVTKFGLFRDVTRKSTKVRTEQGRGYAMLRIVTGRTLFLIMKPGNEEDRNGKERRPTTDKRMNTDSEKTLNRRKQNGGGMRDNRGVSGLKHFFAFSAR